MSNSRQSVKKGLFNGLIWTSGGQFLTIIVNLIINIALSRILSPEEFGIMGIIMFFVLIGDVLAKGGLAGALIRMKEVKQIDYSTVFVFNFSVSVSIYLILIVSSGFISEFYNKSQIKSLILVSGLTLIVNSFQLINMTYLIKQWEFKKRFIYEFIANIFAGIISIVLAFYEFGIWSLAILPLTTSVILTSILIIREGFHGGFNFSKESFLKTYKFGVNTSLASLLETGFENIYSLVLGKYFSISQVGYFYQAQKLQKVPNNVLNAFTQRALFPVLSNTQDNKEEFTIIYKKILIYFTILVGLLGLLIYIYSEPLVSLLFGDKWLGSIFYLKLLIIASYFYMQEQFNRIIFKIFDKTSNILSLELVKKCFQLITIIIGIFYKRLDLLIYGFVITNVFSFFINYIKSRKITNSIDLSEIFVVIKIFISGLISVLMFYFIKNHLFFDTYFIILGFPFVIILYFCLLYVFNVLNKSDLNFINRLITKKKVV